MPEANAKRSEDYFARESGSDEDPIHRFRRKLAIGLINDPHVVDDDTKVRKSRKIHRR